MRRAKAQTMMLAATGLIVLAALTACSSSSSKASNTTRQPATPSTAPTTRALQIVVTNDDGYQADGIDTVVTALSALKNVDVTVVAPATQQSGAGAKTTVGPLTVTDATTKSGHPAHAVAGTPADTIRAALDDLRLKPDLVVSGINQGQNLGPAVDLSGTVGAARAAVARGIPAIAVSAGLGDAVDYAAAAPYVISWITTNRAAIEAHKAPIEVVSFNVPSCAAGKIRGLREVTPDLDTAHLSDALKPSDCTSVATGLTSDVAAFHNGFATESVLAAKPAG